MIGMGFLGVCVLEGIFTGLDVDQTTGLCDVS